jgi:hypothetical protein
MAASAAAAEPGDRDAAPSVDHPDGSVRLAALLALGGSTDAPATPARAAAMNRFPAGPCGVGFLREISSP